MLLLKTENDMVRPIGPKTTVRFFDYNVMCVAVLCAYEHFGRM